MIRIIKQGKKRVVQCSHCDCVFEYEKEDILTIQVGMNEYTNFVPCPCCGNKVVVYKFN